MMKCALLTSAENRYLLAEEKPLVFLFRNKSIEAKPVVWDEEKNWEQYDFALVRSTWDYYQRFPEFMEVLSSIEKSKCILLNSLETIQWNINKMYLLELQNKNVPVFPTHVIQDIASTDFLHFFSSWNTEKLIIKPTISAGAYHTYLVTQDNIEEIKGTLEKLNMDFLLQPFAENVLSEGEYSFIFFGKKYSHTVLKYPTKGDFRVQQEYGGRTITTFPSATDIEAASSVIEAIENENVYARVDMVRYNNQLCLMELELIEPQLFFGYHPISLKIFVDNIVEHIYKLQLQSKIVG